MTMEESVLTFNMRGKYDLFMCDELEEKDGEELLAKIALERQQEKLKKEKERKENAAKLKTQQAIKSNVKKEVPQKENKGPAKPSNAQLNSNDTNKPPRFQRAHENKANPSESGFGRGGGSNRGGFARQFDELEHAPLTDSNADHERSDRGRGRGRGGFSSRGGRGGSARGGRRDFDRHSGSDKTGVKPTEKREGGGAHNWGTVQDDIDSAVVTEEAETSILATPNEGGDEENVEDIAAANEEKELEKQMTLEEWKAKRNQEKSVLAVKLPQSQNMRKANEGKDPFANMVAYRKPKDAQDSDSEEDNNEDGLKKQTIPINIRFYDQARRGGDRRRGGGDRGGRGGGERGGRGGGDHGGRGGRGGGESQSNAAQKAANIQLDNENDFPALK